MKDGERLPGPVRAVLALLAITLLLFTKDRADSWADGSRLGTIQGLVEHGTLALDETDFLWQGDKVRLGGLHYSHQPPMLALLGALPYAVLHHGLGRGITDPFTYRILTWCIVGLPLWLGAVALARLLLASGCGARWSAFLLFAAFFGTLLLPYSLVLNQHGTAAGLTLLAFGAVARGRSARAGTLLALASTIDLTAVFPAVACALPALRSSGVDGLVRYGLGALPPLGLHFGINWSLVGDLLPVGLHLEAFEYPYSPFMLMALTGGEQAPGAQALYLWRALFGYTGFFSHHPITVLAVISGLLLLVRRPRPGGSLLVAAAVSAVGIATFYLVESRNFGGSAFGMRWFAVFSPLLALFPAAWIAGRERPLGGLARTVIGVATAWSVAAAALGSVQPWSKFHYFWPQKPEAVIARPEAVPQDWGTHLQREWFHVRTFRMRFDRESYLLWFADHLHRHGKLRTREFSGMSEADQRAWTREGLDKLRPIVELLDGTNAPSGARTVGHYWMGRMHELLDEPVEARRQYHITIGLAGNHEPALKGLRRLEQTD